MTRTSEAPKLPEWLRADVEELLLGDINPDDFIGGTKSFERLKS